MVARPSLNGVMLSLLSASSLVALNGLISAPLSPSYPGVMLPPDKNTSIFDGYYAQHLTNRAFFFLLLLPPSSPTRFAIPQTKKKKKNALILLSSHLQSIISPFVFFC